MIDYNLFLERIYREVDRSYKEFHSSIVGGNIKILGVRTNVLKKIAKETYLGFTNFQEVKEFILSKSYYYDDKIVKGFIISHLKNVEEVLEVLEKYVLEIDNWAICDMVASSLKIIKDNREKFLDFITINLESQKEFTVRFSIVLLLLYYIDDDYIDFIIKTIRKEYPNYYYIDMAISWLICECFIKQKTKTMSLFDFTMKKEINNKAICKICDSYRVTKEEKLKIKKFRI